METGVELIARIASTLNDATDDGFSSANFEAKVIIEYLSGDDFSNIATNTYELDKHQKELLKKIIEERNCGKPLAYILKSSHFYGIDLYVDERVLIPRSETEQVVEHALKELAKNNKEELLVLDIGTGSGAIAIAIAQQLQRTKVFATDISADALEVANINAVSAGLSSRINFLEGDLFGSMPEDLRNSFDLIISNPPYIGTDEMQGVESSVVEHEPYNALFSGDSGFDHYLRILSHVTNWLTSNGALVFEIAPRHAIAIGNKGKEVGFREIDIIRDFSGRERIAILRNPK